MGVKKRNINEFPAAGLNWDVDFKDGKNTLIALGKTKTGDVVKDELNVNYRFVKNGKAKSLTLEYNKLENGKYLVTATALDKNGLRALDFEERVYFQCLSGGETQKAMGTLTGSEVIEMANGRASIEVDKTFKNIPLKMMVLSQDFKGTYLIIE
jgi:beta-galactosidase